MLWHKFFFYFYSFLFILLLERTIFVIHSLISSTCCFKYSYVCHFNSHTIFFFSFWSCIAPKNCWFSNGRIIANYSKSRNFQISERKSLRRCEYSWLWIFWWIRPNIFFQGQNVIISLVPILNFLSSWRVVWRLDFCLFWQNCEFTDSDRGDPFSIEFAFVC